MTELRALSRGRKLVYFTLVYCMLGLLLLGVCELLVRLAYPPFAMRYNVWPPGTTLSKSADPDSMAGVEGFPDFRINRLGVRGRLPKADDEIRILAIGGSTTACEVLGYEESWPYLLERQLAETTRRKVWLANLGRSGRNVLAHYFDAKYVVPQFGDIDYAVLLIGVNDMLRDSRGMANPTLEKLKTLDAGGDYIRTVLHVNPATSGSLLHRLRLLSVARDTFEALTRSERQAASEVLNTAATDFYVRFRRFRQDRSVLVDEVPKTRWAVKAFERIVEQVLDVLLEQGITPVLVTQPSLWREDLTEEEEQTLWLTSADSWPPPASGGRYFTARVMETMMRRYNEALLRVADRRGVHVIDLASRIPKDLTAFYDDVHFNENGARLVTREIAEYFRQQVLPPR